MKYPICYTSAVCLLLLCGLLCTGVAAQTQVAADAGPGVYDKTGTTLHVSALTVWNDGGSSTVYEGDDLTVTLTLAYIDGASLFVDTSGCTMSFAGPSGSYYFLPDADESDSEAGRVNPECDGEVGVIFDANGGDALICPSGDPVSLVYHIPGEYLPVAGTWTVTPKWSAGLFTDTDGTAYDVSFAVKEFTYIPLFTPTVAHIYTPTPTYIAPTPTPTATSFWYATPTYTKIPTPGGTLPAGIPSPTVTMTPTVTPTATDTAEPTAAPTTAATTATPTATATAGATASPTASAVPTTAPTGTSTPGDTATPVTTGPTATGATTSMTHVPTDATETPVPRGTPFPTEQGPQGISFGWIFGLVILVIAVAAGGYLIGTRNRNIMTEPPADEASTSEERGNAETSEQPDEAETTSE
ncbi:hypothetical protein [Methanovulcanius yangii]|uniref:hypothetical protein n=1 Tax=Methanovulcanius yangii TaxID=1789227 RepID=UPI0029CA2506|nr:hypothetical protein [Methanovulcanius yangii]